MKWKGNSHKTVIMEVENPLEWDLLLTGRKRELRSPKPLIDTGIKAPTLVMLHHGGRYAPFVLVETWREELHEVDDDDAMAEGFDSLVAFKRHWMSKTGSAYFSLMERVWGYELNPFDRDTFWEDNVDIEAVLSVVCNLYPSDLI